MKIQSPQEPFPRGLSILIAQFSQRGFLVSTSTECLSISYSLCCSDEGLVARQGIAICSFCCQVWRPLTFSVSGLDGCRHSDPLLLCHLPGVPDSSGQLQQIYQQLLQVRGAWIPHILLEICSETNSTELHFRQALSPGETLGRAALPTELLRAWKLQRMQCRDGEWPEGTQELQKRALVVLAHVSQLGNRRD